MKFDVTLIRKLLQLGVFLTFIGHGLVAISINEAWIPFLEFFEFSRNTSVQLMLIIGIIDVAIAIFTLFKVNKYVLIYCTFIPT